MRKRTLYLVIIALLTLGLSSQGFCMAGRPRDTKKAASKQMESVQKISGKVSGYSWANSTITITTTSGTSITVEIDKASKLSKAGKWIKMTDIKTADMVSVDYEIKGSKKIARIIVVKEKPKVPEKKKR